MDFQDNEFDDYINYNQPEEARLRDRKQHAREFEEAFEDEIPSSPATPQTGLTQSVEHNDTEMSEASSESRQPRNGDASASNFNNREPSVKSESAEADPYAQARHGSVQPVDKEPSPIIEDSQASSNRDGSQKSTPPQPSPSPPASSEHLRVKPPHGSHRVDEELAQPQAAMDIDDDDDMMIIEPDRASRAARRKWQSYQPRGDYNNPVVIKEEPEYAETPIPAHVQAPATPPPKKQTDIMKVLAQQRALLARAKNTSNDLPKDGGSNSMFGWREDSPQAEGSGSKDEGKGKEAFRYQSPVIPEIYREGREDPMQVDAAMHDSEEDHSWMEEQDDVDEEYESMKVRIAALTNKEKSSNFNSVDRMELFKLTKRLEVKERLRLAATRQRSQVNEGQLFVRQEPEKPKAIIRRHRQNLPRDQTPPSDIDEDDNAGGSQAGDDDPAFSRMLQQEFGGGGLERPESSSAAKQDLGFTKAGKAKMCRAKNAREFIAQEEQARREKERIKAIKKGGRAAVAPKSRGKDTGRGKGRRAKETKKTAKGKGKKVAAKVESIMKNNFRSFNGNDPVGQMILEDLMTNDPISDRVLNPIFERPAEPKISGSMSKETQFQQLFANIPEGDSATNKASRGDKKRLRDASRSFGYAQCKAIDGKWLIKGMKSPLYHHQLIGAQWMVQRELSSQAPNGGLLADSMGLGKTVQMLACMIGNPPGPADDIRRGTKTTLIIVPAGVIDQWLDEIRHHAEVEAFPKILHYKTSHKVRREILQDLDIVVTSYNEVMRQFPYPDSKGREQISRVGYKHWWKTAINSMGDLHHINWFRVVLDEAQAIKNNSARTSLACQNLKSVYRWCLTGTPLLNRLEELFPYLRFLKANYTMDWNTFQKYFCDPNSQETYSRISTLLSYTMMRRTMKTTIMNRPIITLPKPHPEVVHVEFSPEEQIIYRITENRFRSNLNTFFKKGLARRNYGVFMVQLLRLRQCTGHPFMLERTIKESWTLEDVAELQIKLNKLAKLESGQKPFYEQCKVWVEQSEKQREAARARGEEDVFVLPFGKGDYGHAFSFDKAISAISEEELFERVACGICADIPTAPMSTDCGHMFCEDCLTGYMHGRASAGEDYMTCPSCDRVFQGAERVKRPQGRRGTETDEDDRHSVASSSKRGPKLNPGHSTSKGRDALGFEPFTADSTWIAKSDHDPEFPLTPSSKTTALKSILLKGFVEAPLDKVVIYVQFRTLARIIGRICHSEGWGFLYLTGDSTLEHRTKAIRKFRDDDDVKILIAGLKCGGLGLNFPWANRCISLDLWWNHAVEQQAFGRIFRIGQVKETYMTRLVVKNTVDMRMMNMQLHKLQNLERAMRDGEYNRERPNLSLKQLANLFGFLNKDANDNIISIEADYDDEPGAQQGEGSGTQNSQHSFGEMMDEEL